MTDDRIEGFVAGSSKIVVANIGAGVSLSVGRLVVEEAFLSVPQSQRLRRLLSAAERRAKETSHD